MPSAALQAFFASLLPPGVACRWAALTEEPPPPWPEEAPAVARAVEGRRREFAAGRHLARQALAALGVPPCALPARADRAPAWPAGIVGSISHDPALCLVVVGRSPPWVGLGIDIEGVARFDAGHERMICTPAERQRLPGGGLARQVALAFVFTAKEAAFKAQHPHTGAWLNFTDVDVDWPADAAGGAFEATLLKAAGPYPAGQVWAGRCGVHEGRAAAALALPAAHAAA